MTDNDVDILVTLSTFSADSEYPLHLLKESGFTFRTNDSGRRMEPGEVVEMGRNCRGLVSGVEKYTAETLAQFPNLQCISRCGVGMDNIDLVEAERRKVVVLNTPDEPVIAVAELTLAMMLGLLRQLPRVDLLTRSRKWQRVTCNLLAGKTVGIIGLGRIGKRVAELVQAFGAIVVGAEPYPDPIWVSKHDVELMDLQKLLVRADVVSIHVSPSSDRRFCLGTEEFTLMKQGAWLINMARGDMVDEIALKDALDSGRLSGAGLDVYTREPYHGPLCDNDRVILSPHQATLTVESRVAMETRAVGNAVQYLRDLNRPSTALDERNQDVLRS